MSFGVFYSYNTSTGLINVYKRNPAIKDPNTDIAPPRIISAVKSGNSVLLTYDRPIIQSQFSNADGDTYSVEGNVL